MFISKEQLEKRLNSSFNVLNIIKPSDAPLSPGEVSVPAQIHPPIPENLPEENNKQRAARLARFSIDHHESHGEYTVNPNIDNDIVRTTIGLLAVDGSTTSQQIQKEFGLTKNQIIGAKNSKKRSIQEKLQRGRDKVSELAIDKLMDTLGLLDPGTLLDAKPKDLANVAASLSKVVSSMRNIEQDKDNDAKVNVVIYAPERKDINSYSVIDV